MNYQISNGCVNLSIDSVGAQMRSIVKDGAEYLWGADAKYWPEQAPLLFPYIGRFTEGKYMLNGREYEMGIHGFAKKMLFHVACQEADRIEFELQDNAETYACYPRHFILRVSYVLRENTIAITFRVQNTSEERMYFGIGGHPGFRVPLEEGLAFTDYYLEFGGKCCPERIGHTPAVFMSGINQNFPLEDGYKLRLAHELFDNDAIVLHNMADEVTLKSDKGLRSVRVSYPELPYLGIWHAPKTDAPYICIEPWTSLPSRQDIIEEIRYKSDLVRLAPGKEYVNTWSITIE